MFAIRQLYFTRKPKLSQNFFIFLQKCPLKLWPGVISLIQDRDEQLSQEKLVYFFDVKGNMTYFLANVEKHVTLVVMFKGKKNERDSHVVNFFQGGF